MVDLRLNKITPDSPTENGRRGLGRKRYSGQSGFAWRLSKLYKGLKSVNIITLVPLQGTKYGLAEFKSLRERKKLKVIGT